MWRFIYNWYCSPHIIRMQDYRFSTVALPEDKGTAIFKTLELQNSVTSKNTLFLSSPCSNQEGHGKLGTQQITPDIHIKVWSKKPNPELNQCTATHKLINTPKKQMQTRRTKRLAVAVEKKLASPRCNTHKSVHYIQCHSVYSRTKSIQDVNHHYHPFFSIYPFTGTT